MVNDSNYTKYKEHYSEESVFKKIARYAKVAGINVIYGGLLLYYALKKPEMPVQTKAVILGALGYFILPIDIIPDGIPGIGYTDDFSVLVRALITASSYIDEEVKSSAREKLKTFFGEVGEEKLKYVEKYINKETNN